MNLIKLIANRTESKCVRVYWPQFRPLKIHTPYDEESFNFSRHHCRRRHSRLPATDLIICNSPQTAIVYSSITHIVVCHGTL